MFPPVDHMITSNIMGVDFKGSSRLLQLLKLTQKKTQLERLFDTLASFTMMLGFLMHIVKHGLKKVHGICERKSTLPSMPRNYLVLLEVHANLHELEAASLPLELYKNWHKRCSLLAQGGTPSSFTSPLKQSSSC